MKWKGKESKLLHRIDKDFWKVLVCERTDGTFQRSGVYVVIARTAECEFLTNEE